MKSLSWMILAAILVCSVVFAQIPPAPADPIKTLGVPAAGEWIDLESGPDGQAGTTYQVPLGKVLTMVYQQSRPGAGASEGDLEIDGTLMVEINIAAGELMPLHAATNSSSWIHGETARQGEIVTLTRTGGTGQTSDTFWVRGWLEVER